jgi:imidazolonepropionase
MGSTVIDGIGQLVTCDPQLGDRSPLGLLHDAALVVDSDRVAWVGPRSEAPAADALVDAGGRAVIPGFVDSHSHLVFAGDRSADFARHLDEMLRQGTTTVETKSGYGLTTHDEARALAVARQLTPETTFLGAHVIAPEYAGDPGGYVDLVTGPMLEACAPHARWVDVFCERGAFDADQARAVLSAGIKAGLEARVHANQLGPGPGVQVACEVGAAAADHCTFLSDDDVAALHGAGVVATLLPGVEFSTRSPYPDARRLLAAGVTVALASDCNPGSCYSSSMPLCIALAVREMHMSPAEAMWSATAGGAAALRRDDVGRLAPGAVADLVLLQAPSYVHLAYRPGVPLVAGVWQRGRPVVG